MNPSRTLAAYYQAAGLSIPPLERGPTDEYLAFWSDALTAEANRAWLIEDCGECVGFLVAGAPIHEALVGRPVLELIGLYLLPEVWGSGIAHTLHDCFLQLLLNTPTAEQGVLDVWEANWRASAFYRHHGWRPDGRSRPGPAGRAYIGLQLSKPDGGFVPSSDLDPLSACLVLSKCTVVEEPRGR